MSQDELRTTVAIFLPVAGDLVVADLVEEEILPGLAGKAPRHGKCAFARECRGGRADSAVRRPAGPKASQTDFWSDEMAVQQNKKSPSKRGMHRAHDFLTNRPWPSSRRPVSAFAPPYFDGVHRGKKV